MVATTLPKFNMDNSETGCCPRFDPTGWDGEEFEFHHRPFVRSTTINVLHVPLNLGPVFKKTWRKIQAADAAPLNEYLVLSSDLSAWRGEHYFAVTKPVPNVDMVSLTGRYFSQVFEGPYRQAGHWATEIASFIDLSGRELRRLYFFYTTCPSCAKYYGKNFVIAFAEV